MIMTSMALSRSNQSGLCMEYFYVVEDFLGEVSRLRPERSGCCMLQVAVLAYPPTDNASSVHNKTLTNTKLISVSDL